MHTGRYGRWLAPAVLVGLVIAALGVVWNGRRLQRTDPPPRGRPPAIPTVRPEPPAGGPGASPPGSPRFIPGMPLGPGMPKGGPGDSPLAFGIADPLLAERELERQCTEHVDRLTGALRMYSMDYDEHLPPAERWCTATQPYVGSKDLYRCPALEAGYGYALNRNLDEARASEVSVPARVVVVFESSAQVANAADTGQSLCEPPRHPGGNCFGFLDGHVAAIKTSDRSRLGWR